jgi:hypothetical protein
VQLIVPFSTPNRNWLSSLNSRLRKAEIDTYQYGPNCVRDNRDLRAAMAILTERGRAWMEEHGRRRYVAINPALLISDN